VATGLGPGMGYHTTWQNLSQSEDPLNAIAQLIAIRIL